MPIRETSGANPKHLAWVRLKKCCVRSCNAPPPREAHHVRAGNAGGMGMKPPDSAAVPLCLAHHREAHQGGWRTFETKYKIDLRAVAAEMARLSPFIKE